MSDFELVAALKTENIKLKNENKLFRIILDHVSEGVQVHLRMK